MSELVQTDAELKLELIETLLEKSYQKMPDTYDDVPSLVRGMEFLGDVLDAIETILIVDPKIVQIAD